MTAVALIEHALSLECAMYRQGIEAVCPLGLPVDAARWHTQRQELSAARQAAQQAIDDGVNYFDACGSRDGAQLRASQTCA